MSEPLKVELSQIMRGEQQNIVATLVGLADLFQGEVDSREERLSRAVPAADIDSIGFTRLLSSTSGLLRKTFTNAEVSFLHSSSPNGTPDLARGAYGAVLEDFLTAIEALKGVRSPAGYRRSDAAFRAFLFSFYGQLSDWPSRLRSAAPKVTGDSYDLTLSAAYDLSDFDNAFAVETEDQLR